MGIVAKLSECIASRGGNIQSVDVFVPENKRVFYSRRFVLISNPTSESLETKFLKLNQLQDFFFASQLILQVHARVIGIREF